MPFHAFVDESIRRDRYLLCAVLIPVAELAAARALARSFCLPGHRRWHFWHESAQRQRKILGSLRRIRGMQIWVIEGRGREVPTRHECLTALVIDLLDLGAGRLVIESRESQDARDRRTVASALGKRSGELPYVHLPPHSEPALWWPDAVAWSFGAGGSWKSAVAPFIDINKDVGAC
ncbi:MULTISPECIES: hypothetical protein [Nocardia]|uniref:hypothetical protein n=1 Tax=Nocardia TaxID=1817 RepID=UPI0007C71429|nr:MULTISPECIES: hypothetical protein [Nocardia]